MLRYYVREKGDTQLSHDNETKKKSGTLYEAVDRRGPGSVLGPIL